jgi:DNA-binding MarR family transcriptional regulator
MSVDIRPPVLRTWQSLIMARRRVLDAVSDDLKAAGLPGLDVCLTLIVLSLEKEKRLRPVELERKLELPQYTTSRLLDRMEKTGLVRREPCPIDGRGHHVLVTEAGEKELTSIWPVYGASIERHLGEKLCDDSACNLADLLDRICRPATPA